MLRWAWPFPHSLFIQIYLEPTPALSDLGILATMSHVLGGRGVDCSGTLGGRSRRRLSVFAVDARCRLSPSPLASASILNVSVSTRGSMLVVRMSEEDSQQRLWDSRFTSGSFEP